MRKINRIGVEFLVTTDTKNHNFWYNDSWEIDNYKLILELSKTIDTFVHAGGWIGPFTLFAAKIFNKVISLEPDIVAFNELKKNVLLNNFTNVTLYNKAFNETSEPIMIGSDFSDLGGSGTSLFQKKNSIKVECVTIKEIFEFNDIKINSLLMLDVEGSEFLLFSDYHFFEKYRPTIILSLHLTFLEDKHFFYMISCLEKLTMIYTFDLNWIINLRKNIPFKGKFQEINIVLYPKNEDSGNIK